MRHFSITKATPDDNEELCELCKIPLKGKVMLALERTPDFFAGSKIQCEEIETYACRRTDDSKIIGVFSVGKRRVFYNKEIRPLRYFSDLRIDPVIQGSRLVYDICRFITDNNILEGEVAQTIVFADNTVMLRLIERLEDRSKKMSIFRYFSAGNYTSYMVKFWREKRSYKNGFFIRKANMDDISDMQKLLISEASKKQFFPYYDFSSLHNDYYQGITIDSYYLAFNNNELVGITGVWDQRSIKQTKVYDYSTLYKLLRPFINLYGYIFNGFILPRNGTIIKYATLHCIVIKDNDNQILDCLLQQINSDFRRQQYKYFLTGFDDKDVLNKSLAKLPNKRVIRGKHFLVAKKERLDSKLLDSLYYFETGRI